MQAGGNTAETERSRHLSGRMRTPVVLGDSPRRQGCLVTRIEPSSASTPRAQKHIQPHAQVPACGCFCISSISKKKSPDNCRTIVWRFNTVVPLGKPLYKVTSDYQPFRYFYFALSNISSLFDFHNISSDCLSEKADISLKQKEYSYPIAAKLRKIFQNTKGLTDFNSHSHSYISRKR